jgi:hypothetical protein
MLALGHEAASQLQVEPLRKGGRLQRSQRGAQTDQLLPDRAAVRTLLEVGLDLWQLDAAGLWLTVEQLLDLHAPHIVSSIALPIN